MKIKTKSSSFVDIITICLTHYTIEFNFYVFKQWNWTWDIDYYKWSKDFFLTLPTMSFEIRRKWERRTNRRAS